MAGYKDLRTLFHISESDAARIYEDRFNSKESIRFNFWMKDSQAFFVMDQEVFRLILKAERIDKDIRGILSSLPPAAISQYLNRCLIDEIVLTNEIEGVHSSRKEIGEVLEGLRRKDKRGRFQGIVQKYQALSSGEAIALASCQDVRNLYDDLVLEEVLRDDPENAPDGRLFRQRMTHVINEAGISIHDGIEPESKIVELLDQALAVLNDLEIETIARISVFHFMFSYIHPFYDGNGRTNRFISSYVLTNEFSPLPGLRLSYAIKEEIKKYYKAFSICEHPLNRGDLTPFVIAFAGIIVSAMESMRNSLRERQDAYDFLGRKLYLILADNISDTTTELLVDSLIQATLFSEKGLSVANAASQMAVSVPTVYNRLKLLDAKELIKRERKGREVYLTLDVDRISDYSDQASG